MATTDARAGFRLPWSSDRSSTDASDSNQPETAQATAQPTELAAADERPTDRLAPELVTESPEPTEETETPAETYTESTAAADVQPAAAESVAAPRVPSGRKPSKFLADLTKAMQAAAEEARTLALSQLQADAKSHIEQIHARSATQAADLRRTADDDVASVRDWSKAEIARIREETEGKISDRKARLESQIENHAGVIEREIEAVQATVAGFESEMATFFERLLVEEDPTQFATMAERLPEPPLFESLVEAPVAEPETEPTDEAAAETSGADETGAETETPAATGEAEVELIGDTDMLIGDTDTLIGDTPTSGHDSLNGGAGDELDREAAFAAIQAAAEAAASAEVAADAAARAEEVADVAIELIGTHGEDSETTSEPDPRFAALGLVPDYEAAEAEALASADAADGEEIPEIGDDALAARLAGLVPNRGSKESAADGTATQVIVVGLVSVASIASFKRHLGRLAGVQSVGVSSGPEGEFIFAVNHGVEVVLREVIPSLPSFQARVTGTADGVINVTAHDPESDN
jgi:hypothetical protein